MLANRYVNVHISAMLSAGLVFGPCYSQFPDQDGYVVYTIEELGLQELGLEELGLDKDIKKLIKPVNELNAGCSAEQMARVALQFMNGLNAQAGVRSTVDTGILNAANIMANNNVRVDQHKLGRIKGFLTDTQKRLNPDFISQFGYDLKKRSKDKPKEFGKIDDMNKHELLGYIQLFVAGLLAVIPHPIAKGTAAALAATGLIDVVKYGDEE